MVESKVENSEENEVNTHTQVEIGEDGERILHNIDNSDRKCNKSVDAQEKQDESEKTTKNDQNFAIIQRSVDEDKNTEEIYGKSGVDLEKCTKNVEIGANCNRVESEPIDFALEEAGPFGIRQIIHLLLLLMPIILSGAYDMNFIVTSATDEYR